MPWDAHDRRPIASAGEPAERMILAHDAAHGLGHVGPEFRLAPADAQTLGSLEIFERAGKLLCQRVCHGTREHDLGIVARRIERARKG